MIISRIQTLQNVKGVTYFYGVTKLANILEQEDYEPNEPVTPGEMVGKFNVLLNFPQKGKLRLDSARLQVEMEGNITLMRDSVRQSQKTVILVIWDLKGLKKSTDSVIQIQAIIELSGLAGNKNEAPNLFKHPCQAMGTSLAAKMQLRVLPCHPSLSWLPVTARECSRQSTEVVTKMLVLKS